MLKKITVMFVFIIFLNGCTLFKNNSDPNSPQKPYSEWRLSGLYPHYFRSDVFQVTMKTQLNEWKVILMKLKDNRNKYPGKFELPEGWGGRGWPIPYDLPQELYICWASFADQTFYKSKINVPLWARQEMVTPRSYFSNARGQNEIGYYNEIMIGFAPGGHITGWLVGSSPVLEKSIEFTPGMVTTQRIPQGSDVCPNPYIDWKIPKISDEGKKWLKKYGMPPAWQEKNNNITIGPDIRIKKLPSFSVL